MQCQWVVDKEDTDTNLGDGVSARASSREHGRDEKEATGNSLLKEDTEVKDDDTEAEEFPSSFSSVTSFVWVLQALLGMDEVSDTSAPRKTSNSR